MPKDGNKSNKKRSGKRPGADMLDASRLRSKILIVDDSEDTRDTLTEQLKREGFSTLSAASAEEGFACATESAPDLILTDVAMPGMDGREFCRRLRANARTAHIPIILVSGTRMSTEDQVEGIEEGADDYLTKPYSETLLTVKIRAVLRRYSAPQELKETLEAAGLAIDVHARTVFRSGKRIHLTRKEFDLLTTLLRRRGRVLSVPFLLETVWGYDPADYNSPQTVQAHISNLRRKLGGPIAKGLVGLPGLGYRLDL